MSDALNWSMVKRKPPKSLKQLCFEALPPLITAHICRVVKQLGVTEWFLKLYGHTYANREDVLNKQVTMPFEYDVLVGQKSLIDKFLTIDPKILYFMLKRG